MSSPRTPSHPIASSSAMPNAISTLKPNGASERRSGIAVCIVPFWILDFRFWIGFPNPHSKIQNRQSGRSPQFIAHAPDRLEKQWVGRVAFDLFAQAADVDG